MRNMQFNPDINNLGGRKMLVDLIYNHKHALSQIKPTIDTLQLRPALIKKGKQLNPAELKDIQDEKNALYLQHRVQSAKKLVNSSKPITFDKIRKGQPCGAASKQYQFLMFEHLKNLNAQKSRIESLGSMRERKKNFNDFIAHPPLFFRRIDGNKSSVNFSSRIGLNSSLSTKPKYFETHHEPQEQNYFILQNNNTKISQKFKQQKEAKSFSIQSSKLVNTTGEGTVSSQILKSSPNSNSKQYSLLLNRTITNTLNKLSPTDSAHIYQQIQQQQNQIQYEKMHEQGQQSSEQQQQQLQQFQQQQFQQQDKSQDQVEQERLDSQTQKWEYIIEEIPVLLEVNEESVNLLKEQLVQLILQFRLYQQQEYEAMKEIFQTKNPKIENELVNAIFTEIIEAFDE